MINVVAIHKTARPINSQAATWKEAAEKAIRWSEDAFYTDHGRDPIIRVFLANNRSERDDTRMEEHTIESLKADLAKGLIPG